MLELRALSALPEDSRLPKGPQKSLSCESTFPCEEYLSDADPMVRLPSSGKG